MGSLLRRSSRVDRGFHHFHKWESFESIEVYDEDPSIRKALIVCRVIAGRVHRPLENIQDMAGQSGFDSLAGKVGLYSNIEELYLLNPRALLPCFVGMWSLLDGFALGLVHPLDVGVANIEDKVRDPSLLLFLSPRLHFKMVDFIGDFPKGP
ncbi:hypothetical protein CK203_029852 [Vitis vinifera]|uniref:Uncharacterized protein n=1 Tax=Vitis vinifera TaxID=29760 RepID=A0A438IDE8_VITVI|nr:hypothetical protein CK203_029852 [Vitis vinifera]